MNGYEWDGARWVPQRTGTAPSPGWAPPPSAGMPPTGSQFPPLATGGAFTEARYGYGLTRRASDDIAFIARYLKIVIIVGLVLAGVELLIALITIFGMLGLVATIPHR